MRRAEAGGFRQWVAGLLCMVGLVMVMAFAARSVAEEPTQGQPQVQAGGPAARPGCAVALCCCKESESKPGLWDGSGPVLLGIIPKVLWVVFAAWAVTFLSPQIIRLIGRLKSLKGGGVELEFAVDSRIEKAAEAQRVTVPKTQRVALRRRLALVSAAVPGMRILWVDDVQANNVHERELLFDLGAVVTQASATDAAMAEIGKQSFDLVISDMARGSDKTAGLTLLKAMRDAQMRTPMVVYTGSDQSSLARPAGLFGITNRPDELIHLILDVRERDLP
jgi:CheY-like chemotaxis protein